MGNPRLQQIILRHQKGAWQSAERELKEIRRLYGLAYEDVRDILQEIQAQQEAWGKDVEGPALREAKRGVDRLERTWAGLATMLGGLYLGLTEYGWTAGEMAVADVARHLGFAPSPPTKTALDYLRTYELKLAQDPTGELSLKVRGEIMRGLLDGEDVGQLSQRILGTGLTAEGTPFKTAISRAETIARTEVSRSFHEAMKEQYRTVDEIVGYQWLTFPNEPWPCGRCRPRHGQFYAKGTEPPCPDHPRCYCALLPVTRTYGQYDLKPVE